MTRLFAMVTMVIGLVFVSPQIVLAEEGAQAGDDIDRSVLPITPPPFKGKIGRTAADSTPDFPKGVKAPRSLNWG
jgi:hypothetical protein